MHGTKVIHAQTLELKEKMRQKANHAHVVCMKTKDRKSMMLACDKLRLFQHYIRKRERCIDVVDYFTRVD